MHEIQTNVHAKKPDGASFILDSCAFTPGGSFDPSSLDLPESRLVDWPIVYILTSDTHAYVGQTTSYVSRMGQHAANKEKHLFETTTIIYNEEFNASVITDYEHRLIGCMHADGHYVLTNKNGGMTDTNYFSKGDYAVMFEELWEELRGRDIAFKTLDEIEESEVFKYSPYKSLNPEQRDALGTIKAAIDSGLDSASPIVVQGGPGTGKTVLAIYLLKMLKDDTKYSGLNIRLLEPVTSLRNTLSASLSTVSGLTSNDVIGPLDLANPDCGFERGAERPFDILLVDETHRLKMRVNLGTQFGNYDRVSSELGLEQDSIQLDWVMKQAKLPVLFYDPYQVVIPSSTDSDALRNTVGEAADHPIVLQSQMRVRGGEDYLSYVRSILDCDNPEPRSFSGYDFVLHEDFADFVDSFESTYAEHDLTRFLAGYAWKWVTNPKKKSGEEYDIFIDGIGLRWNCTYDNWVVKGADNPQIAHEVGCIHSIQGYDLSYAYVIVGEDIWFNPSTGCLEADWKNYYDRNGKATTKKHPERLAAYLRNIYYVLLTRGIYGTHVYVVDPALRAYFARFFPRDV